MSSLHSPDPSHDPQARERVRERHQLLAAGMLALPNLFLRSALTLFLLYGLLGVVLIAVVQFDLLSANLALAIGVGFAVLQFALGPWLLDLCLHWLYTMRWVQPDDLPTHLRDFVRRVCDEQRMKFPSFGILDDGAPEAFTYGHHPSNARIVLSRGLMELLEPEEVQAVVAHEIGHARNWDMALMTVANLVPLLLYYIYRVGIRFSERRIADQARLPGWAVALGAYVLYVISEYIVLWFSRTREFYADRFAGQATGNPNALARALVKIAYGLAAQDSQVAAEDAQGQEQSEEKQPTKKVPAAAGAWGALNIFDRAAAVSMVVCSASASHGTDRPGAQFDPERVKGAMQWDVWNPWAAFYELHSTHPRVARRLHYLGDQAAALGQEPFVVFDRAKPESYWDDFFIDLLVMALPLLGLLVGVGGFFALAVASAAWPWYMLGVAVLLLGLGCFLKARCRYRRDVFEHRSVTALLGQVKVGPVRPVPVTLTGTIIGKGVPGLIWSEDFVLRDQTGIIFLDYNQPLGVWNWLFGLLRAGRYQGKEVRVRGWYRRAPIPYLELDHLEVLDGSEPSRRAYSSHVAYGWAIFLMGAGVVLTGLLAL